MAASITAKLLCTPQIKLQEIDMKTMTPPVQPATMAFAKSLFTRGTDCFGPEELKQVFGINLNPEQVPLIPFSEEELAVARKRGQFLILFVDKTKDGELLTMKAMRDQFGDRLGDGKLFYDTEWYEKNNKEDFFLKETPVFGWKLVSREVIPDSTNQNYLEQTGTIAAHVRELYAETEVPAFYQEALDEFGRRKDELEKLMSDDWKKAAEELADLKINQLFRETPVEVIYRLIVYYTINKERLLEDMCTWTKNRSADVDLVDVGYCDSGGGDVVDDYPRYSYSSLGVSFSRSSVPSEP